MFKHILGRCSLFLLPLILGACAATQIPPDYKPEAAPQNGVAVFSVSHDLAGGGFNTAIVYLNDGVLSGKSGAMYQSGEQNLMGIPKDSEFANAYGHLYVVSLATGDYEFTGWQISNGSGLRIFPSKDTHTQRFRVNAGEVLYLGNFHGNLVRGKNIFGMTITGDGVMSVGDEQARDLELLFRRHPDFKGKVKVELLRNGVWLGTATRPRLDPVPIVPAPGFK